MFNLFAKIKEAIHVRWRPRPQSRPTPVQPAATPTSTTISYLMNDPTTPDLVVNMAPPIPPARPLYAVQNYRGGGYATNTVEWQAANCFVTIAETLNYYDSQAEKPVGNWPGTSTLIVYPRAGVDLNAYYDRAGLKFFYYSNPRIGGDVFACNSAEIVSHECGHAILDTYRPDFWSAASLEVASFHEFFGDFTAIMHDLTHDELILRALNETGGDLKKLNVIAKLAEQFGAAIAKLDPSGRNPAFLRCAINDFKYANPGTLPQDAPDNELAAEPHNFSRVMLGTVYDIFVMIYDDFRQTSGMHPMDAIKAARDLLTKYMIKTIINVPLNGKFYEAVARTMLWCDVTTNNCKYHDRMQEIFSARNINSANVAMMSLGALQPRCPVSNILRMGGTMRIKLSEHIVATLSNNPLLNVEVEVPHESAFFFNNERAVHDTVASEHEDAIAAALDMVHYLHLAGKVGPDESTPFEIRDGKLVRTRSCCS